MQLPTLIVLSLVAGCGGGTAVAPPPAPRPLASDPAFFPHATTPPGAQGAAGLPAARTSSLPPGTLARADLARVLDGGVAAFLSQVDERPFLVAGRFIGWQIVRFFPGDRRLADGPIQRGDVVLRVNGRAIERPEQLMEVWSELRTSPSLSVDLLRDGTAVHLHYAIADEPPGG